MKTIKYFNEFMNENNTIMTDKDFNCIGYFKIPDLLTVIAGEDGVENMEYEKKSYFNSDLDMNVYVGDESDVKNVYEKLVNTFKDEEIYESVVIGAFLKGDKSCVFCSDVDYSFGGRMMGDIGLKEAKEYWLPNQNLYYNDSHFSPDAVKEECPILYEMIKDYLIE